MAETTVVIEGGATNKSFLLDLLDQPEVIDGRAGRHRLDRPGPRRGPAGLAPALRRRAGRRRDRGVRGRGARSSSERLLVDRARRPPAGPARGRPAGRPQAARHGYRVTVAQIGPHRFRVGIAVGDVAHVAEVELERFDESHRPAARRRPAVPAGHRHPRPDPPGRGRRRHPPGQPRRGRRAALPGARAGRRDPARGRRRGRGRRARCWCWRA